MAKIENQIYLPKGDLTDEEILTAVNANLTGTILGSKRAARLMKEQGRGTIVLLSSKAGVNVGSGSYAYGASKAGIHGLALTRGHGLLHRWS